MTRSFLPIALSVPLAACVSATDAPPTPAPPPAAYMAIGTEPGWTLEITPAQLNYSGDYGETRIAVPNPGAKASKNDVIYTAGRLSVVIKHSACSDGMSDRRYADTVRVVADGKTMTGCGGAILPPDTLAGSSWTFVSIAGVPVAADRPTALKFDSARLSGSAGCNRFSASYRADGRRLTAGPLMATKMACPGPGMAQEDAFFKLMAGPVSLSFPADDTMEITGADGQTAVLKRAI